MGRKKIFIHIGAHKTGSTSIQQALYRSFGSPKHDVNYVAAGRNPALKKHLRIYDALVDDGINSKRRDGIRPKLVLANVGHEISVSDEMIHIISAEELSYPSVSIPEGLSYLSEVGDVTVLFVVREQSKYLDSLYRQQIKRNEREIQYSFDRFVEDDLVSRMANFFVTASYWAEVFGWEKVRIIDMETLRKEGDLIKNFLSWAGLPLEEHVESLHVNDSVGATGAEVVKRMLGQQVVVDKKPIVNYLKAQQADWLGSYLTKGRIEKIKSTYLESNRKLRDRFGVDLDSGTDVSAFPDDVGFHDRLEAEVSDALASYAVFLQQKLEKLRTII